MDLMLYKERQMVGHRSSSKTLENTRRKDVTKKYSSGVL